MMRTWKGFLLGALAASVLSLPAWWARAQVARPATQRLVAHEWGVWLIRRGAVAHLDALAAESPPFVIRTSRPGIPIPPPNQPNPPNQPPPIGPVPPHDPPVVARKPVLFLYANSPMNVRVDVGFQGGSPWLFYPFARESQPHPSQGALSWNLRVLPRRSRVPVPAVASGHWWNDLRRVGASPVIAEPPGGVRREVPARDLRVAPEPASSAERFVFYDGPVAFRPAFRIQRSGAGAEIATLSTETEVWLVGADGRFVHHQVQQGSGLRPVQGGDAAALRRNLEAAARRRGLSAAETRSLLETWRDELFRPGGARAVYFLPRAQYDAMLPLRIAPEPAETVRVGLVIEEL